MGIEVLAVVAVLASACATSGCKDPRTGRLVPCPPARPPSAAPPYSRGRAGAPPSASPPSRGRGDGHPPPPPPPRPGRGDGPSPPPDGWRPPVYIPPEYPPYADRPAPPPDAYTPPPRAYAPPLPPPTQAEAEVANRLLEHGPIVSPPAPGGVLQVRAFIRPGWPITVDFAPEPNTRSYLRVTLVTPQSLSGLEPQRASLSFEIDHDGRRGRRALTVGADRLPPAADRAGGPAVRIADYAIESYRLDGTGQLQRNGDYSVAAPVQVFGFGAGPRASTPPNLAGMPTPREVRLNTDGMLVRADFIFAVENIAYQSAGSVSIADVNLGPQAIHRPTANAAIAARFSYVAKQDFYQIDADIWRECDGVACAATSPAETFTARPDTAPDHIAGAWIIRPTTAPGLYDLYVRAWLHCNGAPADAYHDCADEAAWAYGHAGPIQVLP